MGGTQTAKKGWLSHFSFHKETDMKAFLTRRHAILISAALALPMAAQADQFINILTGGTSGVYYPLGVALGKVYGEKIAGARTQVQSTKASVENLNLLQKGKGELAFALGDSVKSAWDGDAAEAGQAEGRGSDLPQRHSDRGGAIQRHQVVH
jgi:TRAP transporter TAXI family solute receptor